MNNLTRTAFWRLVPVLAAAFIAIGGWLAFATPSSNVPPTGGRAGQSESVTASVSAPSRLVTRPIELVRVGDRVLGRNPDRAEAGLGEPEPDATWVAVDVYQAKPGGGHFYATLLRSPQWVAAHVHGKVVELDREELGAVGRAEVLTVDPAPAIQSGVGRVVTGTFRHQAGGELVRVRVGGESITCTDGHRFWSETASAFAHAKDLRAGDVVRTRTAGLAAVEAVEPAGPAGWVYNLEVAGEHVYEVGTDGILVHNDGCNIVYRVVRGDENPRAGLTAKNVSATESIDRHVRFGSKDWFTSQYISTTKDLTVALKWAKESGNRIVAIDLTKVKSVIVDLSTKDARSAAGMTNPVAKNFANKSKEVLIENSIPASAITIIKDKFP